MGDQVSASAWVGTRRNAAWTYRHPSPRARRIRNKVAFTGVVDVRRSLDS